MKISKQIIFITLIILQALYSCDSSQQKEFVPTLNKIKFLHNFYKDREYFLYSVKYGPINVGDITLETEEAIQIINSSPCYHAKASAKLKSAIGLVFNLNDFYDSFIDTNSLLPAKFSRSIQENKYLKKEYTFFNRMEKQAIVTDTTDKKNIKIKNYKIPEDIEDMISAFYLLRNIPFEEKKTGDTISIDVFMDDRCYNINMKYLGKEKIKSKLGKMKAHILKPIISEDVNEDSNIKVWISDDEKKIPLRMQMKLILSAVELELQEFKARK